jgi:hypothetical protein
LNTQDLFKALALAAVGTALATGSAQATVLPLQGATITATYNGDAAGMLGLDHGFASEPGSNTSALDRPAAQVSSIRRSRASAHRR